MNRRESIKANMEKVEKRYAKTTKGTSKRKPKPSLKIKPTLEKGKIGVKARITF